MRNVLENGQDVIDETVNFFVVESHALDAFPFLYLGTQPAVTVNRYHGNDCEPRG